MPTTSADSARREAEPSRFGVAEPGAEGWIRQPGVAGEPWPAPADPSERATRPASDVDRLRDLLAHQGYLVLPGFLSDAEVARLREDLVGLPDRIRGQQLPRGAHVTWEEPRAGVPARANQVFNVHQLSAPVDAFVRGGRLAAAVEPFLGPHPTLFHTKFIEKAAVVGSEIPWHQDLSYWLEAVRSPAMLTCMIYLDDATADNGCLEVVPGSHRRGLLRAQDRTGDRFRWAASEAPDTRAVRRIEGRAGTAILFGPLLLHRSGANTSNRSRPSISIAVSDGSTWNGHIGFIGRRPRRSLGTTRAAQLRIARIHGPGPHNGAWDDFYRRRALRILAKDFVRDPSRPWLEVSDAFYEEDAFSWFSSQKPAGARLTRYQEYDHVRSNRDDVEVHTGGVLEKLAWARHEPAGLIALCLGTETALRSALRSLRPALADGTVLLIDFFFAPRRAHGSRAPAIEDFARTEGLRLEYVARADRAAVLRVAGQGAGGVTYADVTWPSRAVGIGFGRQGVASFVREELRASRAVVRFKDLFRPLFQGAKQTLRQLRG